MHSGAPSEEELSRVGRGWVHSHTSSQTQHPNLERPENGSPSCRGQSCPANPSEQPWGHTSRPGCLLGIPWAAGPSRGGLWAVQVPCRQKAQVDAEVQRGPARAQGHGTSQRGPPPF